MSKFITKFVTGLSTVAMATSMLIMPATTFAATAGEVYKATDGTVYFIDSSMQKRAFTSWGAFESYGFLSAGQIQNMTDAVMALPSGALVAPQDGRIFCATATKDSDVKGECSLITGGKKAAFTSAAVFGAQGFSFANAYNGDSSFLTKTANIDNGSAAHSAGVLVNNGGTIQLVVSGGLWGTPSMDVFNSWGWKMSDVVTANAADKALTQTGVIAARTAGQLSPSAATTPTTGGGSCVDDGTEGSIDNTSAGSADETEALEGESDVEIYAVDAELNDDGDLCLDRVDVWFSQTATADDDPWTYFEDVSLLVDGKVVATMDANSESDWSESSDGEINTAFTDNEYRMRFTGVDTGLASGESTKISVAVSMVDTLDSADQDAVWVVEIDDDAGFRFTDGTGFTFTEGLSSTTTMEDSFTTGNTDEAALDVSDATEEIDAQVIEVSETVDTNDVDLYTFDIEESNETDVNIEEMTLTFVTSGAENTVMKKAYLKLDDEVVGSETMTSNGVVVFDNLDIDVDADDTTQLTVAADFYDNNAGVRYAEGANVSVSVTSLDKFTDANGNDEGDITPTVSATSNTHELRSKGIIVELVGTPTAVKTAGEATVTDSGLFTITFDVTAFGSDVYIDNTAPDTTGGATESDLNVTGAGTIIATITSPTSATAGTDGFLVSEDDTERFSITVDIRDGATDLVDGFFDVAVGSVLYAFTDVDGTIAHTFGLEDFKTPQIFLDDHE